MGFLGEVVFAVAVAVAVAVVFVVAFALMLLGPHKAVAAEAAG